MPASATTRLEPPPSTSTPVPARSADTHRRRRCSAAVRTVVRSGAGPPSRKRGQVGQQDGVAAPAQGSEPAGVDSCRPDLRHRVNRNQTGKTPRGDGFRCTRRCRGLFSCPTFLHNFCRRTCRPGSPVRVDCTSWASLAEVLRLQNGVVRRDQAIAVGVTEPRWPAGSGGVNGNGCCPRVFAVGVDPLDPVVRVRVSVAVGRRGLRHRRRGCRLVVGSAC